MNIDEMKAGQELNALVAEKVMRWQLVDYETYEVATDPNDYEEAASNDGWMWQGRGGDYEAWQWNPSKDISAAWEVEEEIEKRGLKYRYTQALMFVFLHDLSIEQVPSIDEELWWLLAHATPDQRCRAALKAVQS